jgi:hypothetical protein
MLDREFDSINRDAGLVGHLKLNRGGPLSHFGLDDPDNSMHGF